VLGSPDDAVPTLALVAAALRVLLDRQQAAEAAAAASGDPFSPWAATDSWQPNLQVAQDIMLRHGADAVTVHATAAGPGKWRLDLPDGPHALSGEEQGDTLLVRLDGLQRRVSSVAQPKSADLTVFIDGRLYAFGCVDPLAPPAGVAAGIGKIAAPIPGYVTKLLVAPGAEVKRGQALIVLEAMKMELTLTAPADGIIETVRAAVGEMVEEGRELIVLTAGDAR